MAWLNELSRLRSGYLCLLFFLINLLIRGWHNDLTAMSRDEPFTLYFSQLSIHQFVPIILDTNNPPTFEILLHFWSYIFGEDAGALRWLPTLIMSLGAIPLFLIGKRIDGNLGAVSVSALYLGSSLLMNFSHLDRAYCVLVAGSLFMIYYYLKVYEDEHLIYQVLWVIAVLITCSSHYFGWLMVATQWSIMLLVADLRKKILRRITLSTAFVFLCYLPLGVFLVDRFITTQQEVSSIQAPLDIQIFNHLLNQFLNDHSVTLTLTLVGLFFTIRLLIKRAFFAGFAGLLLCMVLLSTRAELLFSEHPLLNVALVSALIFSSIGITLHLIRGNLSVYEKAIALWAIIPLIGTYFISMKMPIFIDRYLCFSIPALLLSAITLLKWFEVRAIQFVALAVLMALYIFNIEYTPSYNVDNRDTIYAFQDYHSRSNLSIVGPGYQDVDFTYYFDNSIFYNGKEHMRDTAGIKLVNEQGYTRFKEGLRRELLRNRILISHDSSNLQIDTSTVRSVAYYDGNTKLAYPHNGIIEFLTKHYGEPVERKTFMDVYSIYRFEK